MARKTVRRKNPRKRVTSSAPKAGKAVFSSRAALKASDRSPSSYPIYAPTKLADRFVADPWRESVKGVRDSGWYYRGGASLPTGRWKSGKRRGSWAYYKNPTKKRKTRKTAKRNPSKKRRVSRRRPTRVVYMNPIPRRRRRRAMKRANPRKRGYRRGMKRRAIKRNPSSVFMYLGVAAGSALLGRALGRLAEKSLAPSLPATVQPYTKMITQGLLAAASIGVYMGKIKALNYLKPHAAAMAAGFTATFIDTVIQRWAPENVRNYIGAGGSLPMEELPADTGTPAGGGTAGFGRVDVYEAALRGLGQTGASTNIMSLRDYVKRPGSFQDYVRRPGMSDYVKRPGMGRTGESTDIIALSDFNPNYKRWA